MTDFLLSSLYIVTFRLVAYCSSLSHLCVVWGEAGTLWGGRGTDGHISISQPGGPASEAKTRVAYIFIFWRCIITLPIVKHLLARTGLCVSVKAVWNAETHLCVCNFEFLPQRALPPFSLALSLPRSLPPSRSLCVGLLCMSLQPPHCPQRKLHTILPLSSSVTLL